MLRSTSLVRRTSGAIQHRGARNRLPEYLEPGEVETLIRCAPGVSAALVFLIQWRAGLRISEALALRYSDLSLEGEHPTLMIRLGKGFKARRVPVHPELKAALRNAQRYTRGDKNALLIGVVRQTASRWVQTAYFKAVELGAMPSGKKISTHTFRHSAARHWLASGVPINVVSRWLGHAHLQTTLIYLSVLPDPLGDIERVP